MEQKDEFLTPKDTEAFNRGIVWLSPDGSRAFAEAILNPPPPNDALKRAAQRYKIICGL